MLLVAIPKSASTSLMATLGRLHDLPAEQIELRSLGSPAGIRHLHRHHPDIVELDAVTTRRLVAADHIYKQHIPPTPNNVERLAGHPIVVLLRDPGDIIDAYRRAFKSFAMRPVDVDRGIDLDRWRAHADRVGLSDDIRSFAEGWRAAAAENDQVLILDFDDVTTRPKQALNDIERHLGLPVTSHDVELRRERYTRSRMYALKRLVGRSTRRLGVYRPLVRGLRRLGLYRGSEHRRARREVS